MGNFVSSLNACNCIKAANEMQLYDKFYEEIIERKKSSSDIFTIIKAKKGSNIKKNLNEKKWLIIIENVLITNDENKEIKLNFWEESIKYFQEKKMENFFILSLFFFSEINLENCLENLKNYLNEMKLLNENLINKNTIIEILKCYFYLISRAGKNEVKNLVNEKDAFEQISNEAFSDENFENYINEFYLKNEENENLNLDNFIKNFYLEILNDKKIRNYLISKFKEKNNIKNTNNNNNNEIKSNETDSKTNVDI